MKRRCKDCVHYEVCSERRMCDDYYPADGNLSDKAIYRMVEEGRKEYEEAYRSYIRESGLSF